jgi:hypothetical protein
MWQFPYAGRTIPEEIYEGLGAGYRVSLFCDSYTESEFSTGLRAGTAFVILSGRFEGGKDSDFAETKISGSFYPRVLDEESNQVILSGMFSGAPKDSSPIDVVLSGVVSGCAPDVNQFTLIISGELINGLPERPNVRCYISGSITSGNAERGILNMKLSGKFIPTMTDSCNLDYSIPEFSLGLNRIIVTGIFDDECDLNYKIGSFSSRVV